MTSLFPIAFCFCFMFFADGCGDDECNVRLE